MLNDEPRAINIFIPLNGEGTRFTEAGYRDSKAFILLQGKKLISWVLETLEASRVGCVIIAYSAALSCYNVEAVLIHEFPDLRFCFAPIHFNTLGAAETLAIALQEYMRTHEDSPDLPLLSMDCDTCYDCDLLQQTLQNSTLGAGTIFVFRQPPGGDPVFSYVLPPADSDTGRQGTISAIKEKVRISDLACTGAYAFASTRALASYVDQVLSDPCAMTRGEYYISCLIAHMLSSGERFCYCELDSHAVRCMGTPTQVLALQSACGRSGGLPCSRQRVCFDLDGTLVTHASGSRGDDSNAIPITRTIEFARRLQEQGHTIIIHTTRGIHQNRSTLELLEKFDIPFDELHFGKPCADFYVGERAVPSRSDLTKATGLHYEDLACNLHTLFVRGMLTPATLRKGIEAMREATSSNDQTSTGEPSHASILEDMELDIDGNVHMGSVRSGDSDAMGGYARLFLSLSGLDEVMNNTQVPSSYRLKLLDVVMDQLCQSHGEDSILRVVRGAAALVADLIPQQSSADAQRALSRLASHLNRKVAHMEAGK